MPKQIISCVCMTCGVRNDHTHPDGLCQNEHDDWLQYKDVREKNEHFKRAMLLTGMSSKRLTQLFTDNGVKQFKIREDNYKLNELEKLETISQSHAMNMKVKTNTMQVWLSRCTIADGEPYDNRVQIDKLINGVWTKDKEYKAK
jgi:hypothetical protein